MSLIIERSLEEKRFAYITSCGKEINDKALESAVLSGYSEIRMSAMKLLNATSKSLITLSST
jgi:hypothetical protein